ncbi:ABC transporter permease [Egibacter rhizosphaerae]|uniref:ABC transporter permease n=1 Tax=Egibacter rhizosphaerae TaxID=1670831 RepID=A0A411YLB0_9ACTN|nr:ABC transporter permease [Egibacter rhizosphaerae]
MPGARARAASRTRGVRRWHLVAGALVLAAAAGASLFVGVTDLGPRDLVVGDDREAMVFLASRVPRLVAILLAGASMSVAGLIMQHLARNRFVAPSTAGTVESAMLGVVVATLLFTGASLVVKMAIAVAFALAGTAIFLALLRRITFRDVILVPLVGLMFGGVIRALTTFVAYRVDLLQTLSSWTTGDFSGVLRGRYELLWLAAVVAVIAYTYADRFTMAGMGRDLSVSLGLAYERTVNVGLAIVATVTGVTVVVVGAVPFLGLIVPNLVTMALGDNLRRALPLTALSGAAFVLACDVIGRTIRFPYEMPVGTVVGVVGSAIFLLLITRGRHRAR